MGARRVPSACLLVALEEEAARSGDSVHPELRELIESMTQLRPRSAASASTWSGERLQALAAEVAALLEPELEELAAAEDAAQAAATEAVDGALSAAAASDSGGSGSRATEAQPPSPGQAGALAGGPDAGLGAAAAAPAAGGGGGAGPEGPAAAASEPVLRQGPGPGPAAAGPQGQAQPGPPGPLLPGVSQTGSSGSGGEEAGDAGQGSDADAASSASSFDFAAEQEQLLDRIHSSRPGAVGSSRKSGYYGSAWPSKGRKQDRRRALYQRYPVQTLAAVNTVLFDRHGYLPCNRYGVPSDHQLAAVLEGGVGASAALSILYLEVCERLGFPLAARPLEDGRYFVLWPLEAPLTADGQRFLVDPYGRGGLLLMDEVCEIFGVDPAGLRPASRRELLAALLGELRDAHWAAAAGCSPSPGSMTPLSADTALGNKVTVPGTGVRAASLRRALAAAEKRLWLLPDDSDAQLQYGLLLYFSRRYDDAWLELALYLERFAASNGRPLAAAAAEPNGPAPAAAAPAGAAAATGALDLGFGLGPVAHVDSLAAPPPPADDDDEQNPSLPTAAAATAGTNGGGAASAFAGSAAAAEPDLPPPAPPPPPPCPTVEAQVRMLVEKLRLELDFAPAALYGTGGGG
ncbi:hypothetical protein HYH03_000011 [Edaphochlamys debaryana]|uniref:Protein SirB1 N-terminal domain-containing protein n=1 Tax=Edaphochlamys debaryana TaxID=47281 RepID=A0A835YHV8_9CHLO|nr:hypothetical protein HYH03_000011 [Edaphochlamys debaryana]|eukprot:KAG2501503.1 hypothetical protein HYH03_000011 [Edaphochlamys debaryana]